MSLQQSPRTDQNGDSSSNKYNNEEAYLTSVLDIFDSTLLQTSLSSNKYYNDPDKYNIFNMTNTSNTTPANSRPSSTGAMRFVNREKEKEKPPPVTPQQHLEHLEDNLLSPEASYKEDGTVDYTKYVSYSTRDQVSENVALTAKNAATPPNPPELPFSRCVVCTLPFGTCSHTRSWLNGDNESKSRLGVTTRLSNDTTAQDISDLNDVLEIGKPHSEFLLNGIRTGPLPLHIITHMHWVNLQPLQADEINGIKLDLSSPPAMGGSSGLCINNAVGEGHLVIHGGIRYGERNSVFHAYSSVLLSSNQKAVYEDRVFVYSTVNMTWHIPLHKCDKQHIPAGRYGHCAIVLPDRSMWTFGGRQRSGLCSDKTHVWDFDSAEWRVIQYDRTIVKVPAPRYGASAALCLKEGRRGSVVMFGGTNGATNFGDLWIYDLHNQEWTNPVIVGLPPSARHGHSLLVLDESKVIVLGGCCVSPFDESGIPKDIESLDDNVAAAAKRLEKCYELERIESQVAGLMMENESDYRGWKELARLGAQAAALIAKREKDTADCENELNVLMQERAASIHWAKTNASHSSAYMNGIHDPKFMDVIILDIIHKSWSEPNAPPCTGKLPLARMNHTAVNIANKVVVTGGCYPTTTRVKLSDNDIHVLDVKSWRWETPAVEDTPYAMAPLLTAAKTAVRRAKSVLENEISRARSDGIPGGTSVHSAEAESVLKVCKWRLETLKDEIGRLMDPPPSRYGQTGVAMGQRIFFVGGWEEDRCVGSGREMVVLDFEQADERSRRVGEELASRIERERRIVELREEKEKKHRDYLLSLQHAEELAREKEEMRIMEWEDAISRLPPKTIAPQPMLKFANKHTIWVKWDRVTRDSRDNLLGLNDVEYVLYIRGGFVNLDKDVRVDVAALSDAEKKLTDNLKKSSVPKNGKGRKASVASLASGSVSPTASTDSAGSSSIGSLIFNPFANAQVGDPSSFSATIAKVSKGGLFDVRYDVGGKEFNVSRSRIRLIPKDTWRQVYSGTDLTFALMSNIPDIVLERERGIVVELECMLQTLGTELSVEEGSIFSSVGTYKTNNHDLALDKFMEGMGVESKGSGGGGGGDWETISESDGASVGGGDSKAKKKIKESIAIDGHFIEVWQKGKLVEGTGYGQHYV